LAIDRVLNGLARPFFGWVSDQIGRELTMFVAFALEAVGILALYKFGHNRRAQPDCIRANRNGRLGARFSVRGPRDPGLPPGCAPPRAPEPQLRCARSAGVRRFARSPPAYRPGAAHMPAHQPRAARMPAHQPRAASSPAPPRSCRAPSGG